MTIPNMGYGYMMVYDHGTHYLRLDIAEGENCVQVPRSLKLGPRFGHACIGVPSQRHWHSESVQQGYKDGHSVPNQLEIACHSYQNSADPFG